MTFNGYRPGRLLSCLQLIAWRPPHMIIPNITSATVEKPNTKMTNMYVFCWYHSELIDLNTFYMFHFVYSPYWCSNCPSSLSEWESERNYSSWFKRHNPSCRRQLSCFHCDKGFQAYLCFLSQSWNQLFLQETLVLLRRKWCVETSAQGQTGILVSLIIQVRKQKLKWQKLKTWHLNFYFSITVDIQYYISF